jgi:hypothetical protein
MATVDYRDFYIRWKGHPRFKEGEIVVEDPLSVIIQKIEMILFTKKGDFIGDLNFGADIEFLLWETKVSADFIKSQIIEQFNIYIPELNNVNYSLDVFVTEGSLRDILNINITINQEEIIAIFR